jgi:ankyrin repeat protein
MTTCVCDNNYDEDNTYTMSDLVEGATRAHLAVENGDIDAITSLPPSELLATDRDGETALHYAATNGNLKICELLINMNPDIVHIKDIDNKTAYDWAVSYNIEYNGTHQEVCDLLSKYN